MSCIRVPRPAPASRALSLVVALLCAATASAQLVDVAASLDGGEAVPPVGTSGHGSALVTLDPGTRAVVVTGTYFDLGSNQTTVHLHGAAARGATAGTVLTLTGTGGTTGTFSGNGTLTVQEVDDLLNGLLYVNVHTQVVPGGEIRGQLDLVPTTSRPAELLSDPLLTDRVGTIGLGPNIADTREPWGVRLDCTGSPTRGPYAVLLTLGLHPAPVATRFGWVWINGPVIYRYSGFHNQTSIEVPLGCFPGDPGCIYDPNGAALLLPNDPSLPGLAYTAQGYCGGGTPGRLSNALIEHIGLP